MSTDLEQTTEDDDIELACRLSLKVKKLIRKLDKHTDRKKETKEYIERGQWLEKQITKEVKRVVNTYRGLRE